MANGIKSEHNACYYRSACEGMFVSLEAMIHMAKNENWDKSVSGKQVILKMAEEALAKARGEHDV